MFRKTQSPTQEKRVDLICEEKYVKRHLQQNNLVGRMTPVVHFQPVSNSL